MARFLHYNLNAFERKGSIVLLAFSFLLGMLCGVYAFALSGDTLVPLMRGTIVSSVSIVCFIPAVILPFLLSTFVVSFSLSWLLIPICFGKAFLFSFVSLCVMSEFGSSGWFFRWLLMFSDCISLPVLYFFWLRNLRNRMNPDFTQLFTFISLGFLIGSIDFGLISPFVVSLIYY